MLQLKQELLHKPIVYVNRDIERSVSLALDTPGYYIISNSSPFAKSCAKEKENILLIDDKKELNTWELLNHPTVAKWINEELPRLSNGAWEKAGGIVVFKTSPAIERTCNERGWRLLNPSAKLANRVEEKISQIEWLGELSLLLPPHHICLIRDIVWQGTPLIIQYNHSHTGIGTMRVDTGEELEGLKTALGDRQVRVFPFIEGQTFTINAVVASHGTLLGNISYQITGLAPFTTNRFATVGNDWALPERLLTREQRNEFEEITTKIGEKLRAHGWRGAFGVDAILEEKTEKWYLIEVNARQPASVTFESELQKIVKDDTKNLITTFEAHLASLLEMDLSTSKLISIHDGATIIAREQRVEATTQQQLIDQKYAVIDIGNREPGSELLRIRSTHGIMKDQNVFNEQGEEIQQILTHVTM